MSFKSLLFVTLLFSCALVSGCRKKTPAVEYSTIVRDVRPGALPVLAETAAVQDNHTSAIAPVICFIADPSFAVFAGVSVAYADMALGAEIAAKEEGLTVLVKRAFAGKSLRQIDAGRIRAQLIKDFNAFLASGKVLDVVFTRFDIVRKGAP